MPEYKIMQTNGHLNERNTAPDITSSSHPVKKSLPVLTSTDELRLLKRTGLKPGGNNRTTKCFVLALRNDKNPWKYCACSKENCGICSAAQLAFHP